MYPHSVRNYDEITREFGQNLNGFLPVVEFNLRERTQPLTPSDLGSVRQFGKGYDRLKSWLNIAGLNPDYRYRDASYFWTPITNEMIPVKYLLEVDKLQQNFCLAAFIIYFQVFGDGNHRAANYFFRLRSGSDLSVDEKNIINDIRMMFDYQRIEVLTGDHKKSIIALFDDLCRILVTRFNKLHMSRSIAQQFGPSISLFRQETGGPADREVVVSVKPKRSVIPSIVMSASKVVPIYQPGSSANKGGKYRNKRTIKRGKYSKKKFYKNIRTKRHRKYSRKS